MSRTLLINGKGEWLLKFVGMRSNNKKKKQKKTTLNIRREPNHDQRGKIEGGVLQRATDVCQKCSKENSY
jgi:hypothetical protein